MNPSPTASPVQTVLITGGTGTVGRTLSRYLVASGYRVIILTRDPKKAARKGSKFSGVRFAAWDPEHAAVDLMAVAEADYIVHLAGAGVVDKPWTDDYKQQILQSRVQSSRALVQAISQVRGKLKAVVSASAIGWYGADDPGRPGKFVETDPSAPGFLGETCWMWEESIQPVATLGIRLVILRFGIVLSNEGGALPEFRKPLAARVAGIIGDGRQVISWIHIEDLCSMIRFAMERESVQGVYNAVSPNPVDNRTLNLALGRAMYGNKFIALPVPGWLLRLMLGERSIEVLKSATVSADKIQQAGFKFRYPDIQVAVNDLTSW